MVAWSSRLAVALFTVLFLSAFKVDLKNMKLKVPLQETRKPAKVTVPIKLPDPADSKGGLCNAQPTVGLCFYFTGDKNAETKLSQGNQMACQLLKGSFAKAGACPAEKRLGRCDVKAGTPEAYLLIYYSPQLDAAKAEADCLDPKSNFHTGAAGKWQAG